MLTASARQSLVGPGSVYSRRQLARIGFNWDDIAAQCHARRWQTKGKAIVLHNGPLTREQTWSVARINCGPRAVLAAFTALQAHGLRRWERDEVHILGPLGIQSRTVPGIRVRLHRTRADLPSPPLQSLPDALVLAAATFESARPGCGLVAAAVQQRLCTAADLRSVLEARTHSRHRRLLLAAVGDIEQGSQSLSEIDFVRLCRRFHLPLPERQTVRTDRQGRRRYLDATWRRKDGRLVVAEVDGALHMMVGQWWQDQDRQNELVLDGAILLRFPSTLIRCDEAAVARQLQRALLLE